MFKLNLCRAITIAIFAVILLTDLIIFSIGVHNDLPTVAAGYTEMAEFPAPMVAIQLKNNFTITCHFQIFDYYGKIIYYHTPFITEYSFLLTNPFSG
jgi:hypothetical protein